MSFNGTNGLSYRTYTGFQTFTQKRLYNPVNVVPLTILLTNTLSGETSDVLYQNLFGKWCRSNVDSQIVLCEMVTTITHPKYYLIKHHSDSTQKYFWRWYQKDAKGVIIDSIYVMFENQVFQQYFGISMRAIVRHAYLLLQFYKAEFI